MEHAEGLIDAGAKILEGVCHAGRPLRRIAVFAPHPDDEVIGAFSILSDSTLERFVIFVTDGAPLKLGEDGMKLRRARRDESDEVAAFLGILPNHLHRLGIPDQETVFQLPELIHQVSRLISEVAPEAVLIPSYEGGHPDHDSTAFAVHQAVQRLGEDRPRLFEMCLYHDRNGSMETRAFLSESGEAAPMVVNLSESQRLLKQEAFRFYRSQREVLSYFQTESERFRVARDYDFRSAPHSGTLFYERFDWNVDGARWRALAGKAITEHRAGNAS
ncbi:MAG: PIG-L family deacetylase [Verrucomicrobia bacterium]|nr:PIG-L family deacetylase [Verrucomicrobiota bacterium]